MKLLAEALGGVALYRVRLLTELLEDLLQALDLLLALLGVRLETLLQLRMIDQSLNFIQHRDDDLLGTVDTGELVNEEILRRLHRHLGWIGHGFVPPLDSIASLLANDE